MSSTELNDQEQKKKEEQDLMDGGFAVVDRERLIEEETREVTPWYKHFIHMFTAPGKMLEECYGQEPYKGASYGVVGCILFSVLYTLITFFNPATKQYTIDLLRKSGIAEEKLQQIYSFSMISGVITGVIGVFLGVLIATIAIEIIKAIGKDKAKFGNIFKMLLAVQTVVLGFSIIDGIAASAVGVMSSVFHIGTLIGVDITKASAGMQTLCSIVSLSNIIYFIWLVIGYRAITHVSTKKAVIVAVIYQILATLVTYGFCMASQMTSAMAQ